MKALELLWPDLHAGAERVKREIQDFRHANGGHGTFWLVGHRDWRKTTFAVNLIQEFLVENYPVFWYAPTYDPIENAIYDMWAKVVGEERILPGGDESFMNWSKWILRIPGCGPIFFKSLKDASGSAGPTGPVLVIDESGAVPDKVYEGVIAPIYKKGRQAYPKGICLNIGTFNREGNPKNDFYHNTMAALSGERPGHKAWIIPVEGKIGADGELHPQDSPYCHPAYRYSDELRADYHYSTRKQSWRIEWLCSPEADEGSQFSDLHNCLTVEWIEVPAEDGMGVEVFRKVPLTHDGQTFQMGVDVGIVKDWTAIGVLEKRTQEMVYFRHYLPGTLPNFYRGLKRAMRLFPGRTLVDVTGQGRLGDTHIELAMSTQGYPVEGVRFDVATKPFLLDNLASVLARGQARLFNLPVIQYQLENMMRSARKTGGFTIQGAQGVHDDIPMMLAAMIKDIPLRILDREEELPAWLLSDPTRDLVASPYIAESRLW